MNFSGIQLVAELLPFELTQTNIMCMIFSCLLTFLVAGSTFIFLWEKCVLAVRQQRERNSSIFARERQMELQLIAVAGQVKKLNMPASHGLDHARMVFFHAVLALSKYDNRPGTNCITMADKFAVLFAALLHDADDRKYFPSHKNFENARAIMRRVDVDQDVQNAVVRMIRYASCFKNYKFPVEAKMSPWVLIPKHCDRLEAIGWIGVIRAWKYSIETREKLSNPATLRATTRRALWKIATRERYDLYLETGRSGSMIDHYYDKLLHLHKEPMHNTYLDNEKLRRIKPIIRVCLRFGRDGKLKVNTLKLAKWLSLIEACSIKSQVRKITPMSREMRNVISIIMSL